MSQSGLNVDFLEILRRLSALIQSSLDALLDRRQVRNARRADTPSDLSQFDGRVPCPAQACATARVMPGR